MSSEWQLNRIGLLNFWYYDDQEFQFQQGRMLLRGANGSGKSVTMQSFIPLLLDGDIRPQRLDPFGSKARKMENYLLEENDGREERTGYLYMELKRADSETFITVGMGLRARRNKRLDTWYYSVTDGRRIGRDLLLYKDMEHKITCTKLELRNRIGGGGKLLEGQKEYMQYVNKLLFGFETIEEYQELVNLLIQLRTPKLSKDFKPTIINDILSRSLQTLSEDDLRPMSEAVENMDAIRTNLDQLHDSVAAAREIERVYDRFNQAVLFEKARDYVDVQKTFRQSEKQLEQLNKDKEESQRQFVFYTDCYQKLEKETEILEKEKDSLQNSDAARLREEELKIEEELQSYKKQITDKEKQEQDKKDRYINISGQCEMKKAENERLSDEIHDLLEEMEEAVSDIAFDEIAFLKAELLESQEKYDFSSHKKILSDYTEKVQKGYKILQKVRLEEELYNRHYQTLEEQRARKDKKEREKRQKEDLLDQKKNDWLESFYQWERSNQELHLKKSEQNNIHRMIENYFFGSDFSLVYDIPRECAQTLQQGMQKSLFNVEQSISGNKENTADLEKLLEEWMQKKDAEPEMEECVKRNRQILREKRIPFLEFYKSVDFPSNLSDSNAAILEEAFDRMGILNALIVDAEYREEIRQLDPGVCDRYLFGDAKKLRNSFLQILEIDNPDNDIFKYQAISNILSSIGMNGEGIASIYEDGFYKMGILEGTISKNVKPCFIGAQARERYRQEQIAYYEKLVEESKKELEILQKEKKIILDKMSLLKEEIAAFPLEESLKKAAKEVEDVSYLLEQLQMTIQNQRLLVEEQKKKLDQFMIEVHNVCGSCYITARLDVFEQALDSLSDYHGSLLKVELNYERLSDGKQKVLDDLDKLEDIDADLDMIRYELGSLKRKYDQQDGILTSVRQQLLLTDYTEIREKLDYCIGRLLVLPKEREEAVRQIARWQEEEKHLTENIAQATEENLILKERKEAEYKQFFVELKKKYVFDEEKSADQIVNLLRGKYANRRSIDLQGSLQEEYHKNRAYLTEYQLTMQTRDGEKRLDLLARYRGSLIPFKELILKLERDEEDLQRVLSDKDRELFEDILANTIGKKIRAKIQDSKHWVQKMNSLMNQMNTSSGLKLSLNWKNRKAETEEQLDTKELVSLLEKDVEIMRLEEVDKLSMHFRSKIAEARKQYDEKESMQSFHAIMREILDYRQWFEFTLECQKTGEKKKELTDRIFFTFSGGEKAMSMYVPLFSAVVAKYAGARQDAPRLISLDEAFAGVDENNIRDMFRLMVECKFNFLINSQILWGDYDTVSALAIYQLLRPENAKFVTVIPYIWNGKERRLGMDA